MLKRQSRTIDLARIGRTAKLLNKFGALRKSSGTQRMTLGQKTTRWVGYVFAAIGVVAVIDEFRGIATCAKAESLVGDQLVMSETIV